MQKIILSLAVILLSTSISYAQTAVNPNEALSAKKAAVENKLKTEKNARLTRIDAQIARAKAHGKSTENLEKRRAEIINRISAKEDELNKRIDTQKAKIKK